MPFALLRRRGGYFVVNQKTGRRFSSRPLPEAVARRQLRAIKDSVKSIRRGLGGRRAAYLRALHGEGWWDDITGFFTKAFDATIGKIPVVGDIVRKVGETVLTPLNTVGNMAQAATEGDWKGVGKAAITGLIKATTQPSIAQIVTAGTPLAGVADLATNVLRNTVPIAGGLTLSDAADVVQAVGSLTGLADEPADPEADAAPAPTAEKLAEETTDKVGEETTDKIEEEGETGGEPALAYEADPYTEGDTSGEQEDLEYELDPYAVEPTFWEPQEIDYERVPYATEWAQWDDF